LADARHLPHGRYQAGDRHLKFHETRDNLVTNKCQPGIKLVRSRRKTGRQRTVAAATRPATALIEAAYPEAEHDSTKKVY